MSLMPVSAKICGVSTPHAISAAVAGGASHIGFVFFPKSPRNVTVEQVAALMPDIPGGIERVGVFVNPDDDLLTHAVKAGIDIVQLHGEETPQRAYAIRQKHSVRVWKAIPVRTKYDLGKALTYVEAADLVLFDAKAPPGVELHGGMGLRFDWRLLDRHQHRLPWALSGGLHLTNVAEAVGITGARLVDVSSGVESAPGVKDVDKIASFLQAVARL